MDTNDEPPDELRVRLTWPSQPQADEIPPYDVEGEDRGGDSRQTADLTPPRGTPPAAPARLAPPEPSSVAPTQVPATPAPSAPVARIPRSQEPGGPGGRQKPMGRWAATRKAAATRAAAVREQSARAAAERVAAERAAAERAASERAAAAERVATLSGWEPRAGETQPDRAGSERATPELAAAERAAAERAAAERAAAERAAARRAANERVERAAAERAAANRAAADRATSEREAFDRAAGQQTGAQQTAAERDAAERFAAEREAAEREGAERAAAERAATEQAAAERARAEAEHYRTDPSRSRPTVTVDLEAEVEEDDDDRDHHRRPTVTTQELILAGRADSLQAALASIALRIDALTSTTSTFRNLVSDRITDYAEQVGRLAAGAASDLDDYRHLHERSLEHIRRSVGDTEDNIRRLARTVADVESKLGALVAAVRESGDAVDHLSSERDKISDTLLRSLDRIGQQVQAGLEQGMEDASASLTRIEEAVADLGQGRGGLARVGDMIESLSTERDRQDVLLNQLQETVIGLADDREHNADVLARLERAIADAAAGRERGQAKALARLESRVDEVIGALAGLSGDDLAATLTRLDIRLKEMSTELVVGRDRETAKTLAQLSGQVDEILGLVAESRNDLQPIEARLNRMARVAAAPIDLSDLYARLDELADAIAQQPQPEPPPGPDPSWAAAIERLEQLLPALEDLHAGGAGLGGGEPLRMQEGQDLLERFDRLGQHMGDQLEALRRRIALRARPEIQGLDESMIAAIADAVAARLSESGASRGSRTAALPPSPPALARSLPQRPSPASGNLPPEGPRRGRSPGRP